MGEEQELDGVELLGLAAVACSRELFELVLELLVQVGLLRQRREQLADELVASLQVVGECVGGGHHPMVRARAAEVRWILNRL